MRILYVCMKYNYGRPQQGYDPGHYTMFETFYNMGHDILYFDYMTLIQQHGKQWMNDRLVEVVKKEKPDVMYVSLFEDQFEQDDMRKISESGDTVTLNWFADDHWRFENYTRYWAPCFNWCITTATSALPKYKEIGYKNVIKSQWACNHFYYHKMDLPLVHDVTFLGMAHGDRKDIEKALKKAGIDIKCWGESWERGRLTPEEMIKLFNQSKINLNLSNASVKRKGIIGRLKRLLGKGGDIAAVAPHDQIKLRNFEIPGCGGFTLSGKADNLDEYYVDGKEIATFSSLDDLIGKINYYLEYDEERKNIAEAGYKRTLKEHTYMHRFNEIFSTMGLETVKEEDLKKGTSRDIT